MNTLITFLGISAVILMLIILPPLYDWWEIKVKRWFDKRK